MKKLLKNYSVALALFVLTGCGFSPIYGSFSNNPKISADMNNVAIANIPEHEGQMLRNYLIDRMYHKGRPENPTTTLEIILKSSEISLGLQKDATTSRQEYNLTANYTLKDKSARTLASGTARSIVSYNKLDAQYGTLASRKNASERAVKEVSEQIINRISLYFAEKADSRP